MDTGLVAIVLLVVGLGMGSLLAGARYIGELRRIARFLRMRDPQSNARVTVGGAPGVTDLADAVNAELDRGAQTGSHTGFQLTLAKTGWLTRH